MHCFSVFIFRMMKFSTFCNISLHKLVMHSITLGKVLNSIFYYLFHGHNHIVGQMIKARIFGICNLINTRKCVNITHLSTQKGTWTLYLILICQEDISCKTSRIVSCVRVIESQCLKRADCRKELRDQRAYKNTSVTSHASLLMDTASCVLQRCEPLVTRDTTYPLLSLAKCL